MSPTDQAPPTIVDVAQAAGVSRATASRALSGYGRVSSETVEVVQAAAHRLGYRPNTIAKSMRSRRTKTIGLVMIADLTSAFFARATKAIVAGARADGLEVLIVNTDENPTVERQAVETLLEKRVDGLIVVVSSAAEHPHLRPRYLRHTPVVLVDRRIDRLRLTSVTTDDESGARMAVAHAADRGHRRLGFAASVGTVRGVTRRIPADLISTTQERVDGFREGARAAGIPRARQHWAFCGGTPAEIEAAAGVLLDVDEAPTLVVAANNDVALGIMAAASARGLQIGRDLSLIMFDDSPWAALPPGITVVARPVEELGSLAVSRLLAEIAGEAKPGEAIVLPTTLIERGSVADLRTGTVA